jgi:hypothetical protein
VPDCLGHPQALLPLLLLLLVVVVVVSLLLLLPLVVVLLLAVRPTRSSVRPLYGCICR